MASVYLKFAHSSVTLSQRAKGFDRRADWDYTIINKEAKAMEFAKYLPFWDKLSKSQQEQVAGVIENRKVKKGTRIHDSSADCLGLVIMRSGQLRAYILHITL